MRVVCVLRAGGEFKPVHVERLQRNLAQYLPGHDLVCLSNVPVACDWIELKYDWHTWWSKMELFRPDLFVGEDIFFLDLDTVIVRDISHFLEVCRTTMLTDFLQLHPASGIMYLAAEDREPIWREWMVRPELHIRQNRNAGDQGFLRGTMPIRRAARWQDRFPGQIISYKRHIWTQDGDRPLHPDARIVCFHGQPRPWQIRAPWVGK